MRGGTRDPAAYGRGCPASPAGNTGTRWPQSGVHGCPVVRTQSLQYYYVHVVTININYITPDNTGFFTKKLNKNFSDYFDAMGLRKSRLT